MASTTGRRVVEYLTNKSGGAVAVGDVVVVDTTNDSAFTTSTAGGVTGTIGVAQDAIANNAAGRICTSGQVDLVNVNASVTRGNFGKTYTVVKQATDAGASRTAGAFCQFLTGGTSPKAHLFGLADSSTASSGVPAGTSFPGSPSNGDLYYRTDLDLLCRYRSSGTRWVTCDLMDMQLGNDTVLQPFGANGQPQYANPFGGVYDLWMENWYAVTSVATTNNGTNFWTCVLEKQDGTDIVSFTTAADTASTITNHTVSIAALLGTSTKWLQTNITKTLAPGTLVLFSHATYRLVIT